MFIDLQKHHTQYIIPLLEKRMEVLKRRILKKHGSDWYDYDDSQIHSKCIDLDDEFYRLDQSLDELYRALEAASRISREFRM